MFGDTRLPDRFWAKIAVTRAGCWQWTASINPDGYAVYRHNGRTQLAHLVAYRTLVGPVPPETPVLDHVCRNRSCVNAISLEHLEPVTNAENVVRGANPPRKGACPAGHPYTRHTATWERNAEGALYQRCLICLSARNRRTYWAARAGRDTIELFTLPAEPTPGDPS